MSGNLGKLLVLFFLLLCFSLCSAQIKIVGTLDFDALEFQEESFAGIQIELFNLDKTQKYTYTNANGEFHFEVNDWGSYSMVINDLDYEGEILDLVLKEDSPSEIKVRIPISRKLTQLNEVLIDRTKIKEKGDTIVFDAKLFAKGDEKVVEDLLKRIPGLEVDKSGNILVNGKEVERVMIEGDDFFEKGYKMVTQNMPSKPINKVEVLQNYSHNALLKGFEESDKIALNLTLDNNAKNQWFGNANLMSALYPENNYKIQGNLMSFGKNNKHYFLTNFNDIGESTTADLSQLYRTNNTIIGDQLKDFQFYQNEESIFGLDQKRYRFNNMKLGSLNSIFNLSEKIKLKPKITTKWDRMNFESNENTQYFIENDTIFNRLSKESVTSTFELKSALDWELPFSSNSNALFSSNFALNQSDKLSSEEFNTISSSNNSPLNSKNFDQKMNYTNRLNGQNVWFINLRYIHQNKEEELASRSEELILPDVFENNSSKFMQQEINRKLNFLGAESKWIYKTAKDHLWEGEVNFQTIHNQLNSAFFLDENTPFYPESFQNRVRMLTYQSEINLKYTHTFSKKWKWINKVGFGWVKYKYADNELNENSANFSPKLRSLINYIPNSKHTFQFGFQYDNESIDYSNFYNQFIRTSSRGFSRGISQNQVLPSSRLALKYNFGKFYDKFNFGLESSYTLTEKYVTNRNDVFTNFQVNQLRVLTDKTNGLNHIYVSYLFEKLYHYIKLSVLNSRSNYQTSLNSNELRDIQSQFTSFDFTLNSSLNTTLVNYSIGGKWVLSDYVVDKNKISQQNFEGNMNLSLNLSRNYAVKFSQQLAYFPDLSTHKTYYFGDVDFGYNLSKYNLGFNLKLRNISNTKTYRNTYLTDYYQSEAVYNLHPRMLLLGVNFKL